MPFTLTTFLLLVFVYTQLIIFGGAQSRKYDFPILKWRKGRTNYLRRKLLDEQSLIIYMIGNYRLIQTCN